MNGEYVLMGAMLEPDSLVGPYRLGALLGEGGIGVVYRGFHERLQRPVALKRLLPDKSASGMARKRFLREAQAAARLNHPAVVQIYDILEHHGDDWIAMELVDGSSLSQTVQKTPMVWPRAVAIGKAVVAALEAAHAVAILHRDLKTQNVMLSKSGEVKVVDFGLARDLRTPEEDSDQDEQVIVVGTPRCLSPEQAMSLPLDERSDLFSFGVLLYEILTAKSPFLGQSMFTTLSKVCTHCQSSVREIEPSVPPDLSKLVDDLLEKAPEDRPPNARTVGQKLQEIASRATSGVMTRTSPTVIASPKHPSSSTETSRQPSTQPSGNWLEELRQVIVCYCLLEVGVQGAPAEYLSELQEDAMSLISSRRGGHFIETPGEACLAVCLGYPQAFEDDVRSAVLVARSLLDLAEQAAHRRQIEGLRARCGLHQGVILTPPEPAGEPPDLQRILEEAARIGQAADHGQIVIKKTMLPLITDYFSVHKLKPDHDQLGRQEELFEIPSEAEEKSSFELTWSSAPVRPVVGRQTETRLLEDTFRAAADGGLQVAQICGEGGIGKTTLLSKLRSRLEPEYSNWLTVTGSPETMSSPFFPIPLLLSRFLGVSPDLPISDQVATLDSHGKELEHNDEEYLPYLASQICRNLESGHPISAVTPEERKQGILEALTDLVGAAGQDKPLVLEVEDLHWLDPSTLEWITLLIEERPVESLFLVLTFRPHFVPPWGHRADVIQLNLNPLAKKPSREFIQKLGGQDELPKEVVDQIVAKTDGVPLFIEQVTRSVLEAGAERVDGNWPELEIPESLRSSLMARLDRLGTAKAIAQYASVVGREFTLTVLQAVVPTESDALQAELKHLTAAGILSRRGVGRKTRFIFRHALIHETAYESLLRRDRQALHGKIVKTLNDSFPEIGRQTPEFLAQHCALGGLFEQAVGHRLSAASKTLGRSANLETISHCEEGLSLLERLAETEDLLQVELNLHSLLAQATTAAKGPAAPELERVFLRMEELAKRIGDGPRLTHALRGLFELAHYSGNSALMLDYSERFLRHAEQLEENLLVMEAHFQSGMTRFFRGDLDAARRHKTEGLKISEQLLTAVADPEARAVGQAKASLNRSLLALILWMTGHIDRARAEINTMLEQAKEIDPLTRALVEENAAGIFFEMGLIQESRTYARAAFELSHGNEFFTEYLAQSMLDVLDLHERNPTVDRSDSKTRLEATLAELQRNGARFALSFFYCRLAAAHVQDGEASQAERCLQSAQELIEALDERAWLPEMLRIRGELFWEMRREQDAILAFEQAIEAARNQGAKSFELRAALSLIQRTDGEDARRQVQTLLTESEGDLMTADLRTAKELLTCKVQ